MSEKKEKIASQEKLRLLDLLNEQLEVHLATVKNLLRNNQNEKERVSGNLTPENQDEVGILIDCERSIRRLTKDFESIEKDLKLLRYWRLEISDVEGRG